MTYGSPELGRGEVLEHGSTRTGRWLRGRRTGTALWIAVLEGALVVFDVISLPVALIVAVAVLVLYFTLARRLRSDAARQAAWIAAVSQAFVALVPVLVVVVGTLALILVAMFAVFALVLLFAERR
jgi:hypothetical protein